MLKKLDKGTKNAHEIINENFENLNKGVQVIRLKRDLANTGTQNLGSLPQKPKLIKTVGTVHLQEEFTMGGWAAGESYVFANYVGGWIYRDIFSIAIHKTGVNATRGAISVDENNLLTIQWTHSGSGATGEADIVLEIHY